MGSRPRKGPQDWLSVAFYTEAPLPHSIQPLRIVLTGCTPSYWLISSNRIAAHFLCPDWCNFFQLLCNWLIWMSYLFLLDVSHLSVLWLVRRHLTLLPLVQFELWISLQWAWILISPKTVSVANYWPYLGWWFIYQVSQRLVWLLSDLIWDNGPSIGLHRVSVTTYWPYLG